MYNLYYHRKGLSTLIITIIYLIIVLITPIASGNYIKLNCFIHEIVNFNCEIIAFQYLNMKQLMHVRVKH